MAAAQQNKECLEVRDYFLSHSALCSSFRDTMHSLPNLAHRKYCQSLVRSSKAVSETAKCCGGILIFSKTRNPCGRCFLLKDPDVFYPCFSFSSNNTSFQVRNLVVCQHFTRRKNKDSYARHRTTTQKEKVTYVLNQKDASQLTE